ncbi:MAG: RHS repeat domain-containing protein [Candidatus Acidiferrales bacterium]
MRPCGDYYAAIYFYTYSGWEYTDGFHASHPFSIATTAQYNSCTDTWTYSSGQGAATDGSHYYLSIVNSNQVSQLLGPDGSIINPFTGTGSIQDRNGNGISLSSNGVITDTLGQTALTLAGSGTPSSPHTFTYQAPSGANPAYTEKYTTQTVQTNFGCSGTAEWGPFSESLVSEIDLPDGSKYTFAYEATPGHSGNVTGRLASIGLPTGGTISYSYSGGSNGITCADGSTATLSRTTPDGTWSYAHTESGAAWTTTITDPQANKTVLNFQGIYQTEQQVYSGTSTLLKTVFTCYNGAAPNCNSTSIPGGIAQRAVYTQWPSGLESETVTDYTGYALPTEEDDYDYGSGSPGSPLRKILISYASLGNNIFDEPASITVQDGSGHTVAQTAYTYDQTTPTALSGTPEHASVSGSRGNPTTISYRVTGSATLSKSFTYYDTGNIQTATDVNGAQSTYNYPNATSTCGNAFPTSVTEPLSLTRSMTWNCNGGVMASLTDENNQPTTYTWNDPYFWRTNAITDPENNVTNLTYASLTSVESSLNFNGSTSTTDILATLDGLGRTHITQRKQSPSASNYDSVETDYDSLGRPSKVTVPYTGTAGQTGGSAPATTATYDALSRPLVTTDGGNGTLTLSYSANDILQTVGPAPTGENTKQRQSEYNGIGQLTSVCEVTSLTGSGSCAQNTSATGYWTKYSHDALGDLTGVTQNAQTTGQQQTRGYTYDDLGRLTSETNPETGTINYAYDSDATCGTSNGDLVKKTDAAGNVSCYAYDALHRATSITYPSGPNSSNTPSKYFIYDSATVNSVAMANAKSRLAEAYTCVSPCSSKITDEGFSYTVRGEVQDVYESTPHSGGYFHVDETYWANGALNQISGLSGLPTLTYSPDGEGRANSVSASSGQNPISGTSYNVASEATQLNLGSSDSDAFSFDPNTFRMTQYQFNVNGQSVTGALTWNANGSLGKLAITDAFNSANTQTCTYSHDDLSRIASANCGSVWSQTFTYDAFGNITKTGSSQFQPGYNWQTNQMSSGASYDSNGDVLNDSLHSYAWNSDTRPTTIDAVSVTYDALGRMVEQNNSGSYTQIVWSPTGAKLAYMNGQTFEQANVPLPAGAVAAYNSSGLLNYHHADWLGSYRLASTPSRTVYWDGAYAPFGEPYAQSGGSVDLSFTGQNQDTTSNLYDFMYREYGIQGRWPSPDPAGLAAANPANPQSWNRYAYALNMPLNFIDPLGLEGGIPYDPAPIPFDSFAYSGIPVYAVSPDLNSWLGVTPISTSTDLQGAFGIPLIGNGLSLGPFGQQNPQNPQNPTPPNPTPRPNPNNQPQSPTPQPNQSKIKIATQKVCGAIGKVGDFVGISGVAASVTGTGSIAGTAATTGITELGVGGVSVGALELTPIGWGLTAAGLVLIGADLACSF